jgi:hypothetical protein
VVHTGEKDFLAAQNSNQARPNVSCFCFPVGCLPLTILLSRLFEGKDYVGALALVGELLKEVIGLIDR